MTSLLLELYIEEIPAMMQKHAEIGYAEIFSNALKVMNITYLGLKTYVGPRRVTLHIQHIDSTIPSKIIELKGPKINAPEVAIVGFCKSNNITQDALTTKIIKDSLCYVYEQRTDAQNVADILPDVLSDAISGYTWPKSMIWGSYNTKFVRPLKNILCLFGDKVLPITYGHLKANNKTFGHRFMHYHEVEVTSFEDYKTKLSENLVVLSREERKRIIEEDLCKLVTADLRLSNDTKLLEEVVGLVEYPNVLKGKIPEKFMHVPSEILITAMRQHQRYFTLQRVDGSFAPYFLFVSNLKTDNPEEIIRGNEKVLSARLSDAEYFYRQDQKTTLKSRSSELKRVIFHTKLGNMQDKVERIEKITQWLAPSNQELHLAARFCKSDLVTEVVGEFPELQGIMGGYYAKLDGLSNIVVDAIKHHYKPEGVDDDLPQGDAALLALADKTDSLVSLYFAGERSSGSKDPYALRRYALSIIRIILGCSLRINITQLVSYASSLHNSNLTQEILLFIEERLKHYMLRSYSHGVVNATINLAEEPNIVRAKDKLIVIDKFLSTVEGRDLLTCYNRASSILSNTIPTLAAISTKTEIQSVSSEEQTLSTHLHAIAPTIDIMLVSSDFIGALRLLATLLPSINQFFDNVTVMDKDISLATQRLALLRAIVDEFHKLARFSEIN